MDGRVIVGGILATSGLSKAVLCRNSGVSRSALDSYLSGQSSPAARQIDRLAAAGRCAIVVEVKPKPAAKPIPESLEASLDFGVTMVLVA